MLGPGGLNGAYCRIIRTQTNVSSGLKVKLQLDHPAKVHAFFCGLRMHALWFGSALVG